MLTPWIFWAVWSLVGLGCSIAVAAMLAPPASGGASRWLRPGACALAAIIGLAVAGEAAIATFQIEPGKSRELVQGKIVALIYREGYRYQLDGKTLEAKGGWYLKIGEEAPDKPATDVAPFPTPGDNPKRITHPETPAATMRATIQGLSERPIQVCTGSCKGIAAIPDQEMTRTAGIVLTDWMRLQASNLGQPALGPVDKILPPEPLSAGRWMLALGLGLVLSALVGIGAKKLAETTAKPEKPRLVRAS